MLLKIQNRKKSKFRKSDSDYLPIITKVIEQKIEEKNTKILLMAS